MPHFAANLSMLWPELDVYDRFKAAADAGFSRVEILFVHALDHVRVARLLKDHGLELEPVVLEQARHAHVVEGVDEQDLDARKARVRGRFEAVVDVELRPEHRE